MQTVLVANEARPLHGIPILIKNNIATDDEMNNTGVYLAIVMLRILRPC